LFNKELIRSLKAMHRWPLRGTEKQKKETVAYALLQMYCEIRGFCSRVYRIKFSGCFVFMIRKGNFDAEQ
jgi:hypothetical protein